MPNKICPIMTAGRYAKSEFTSSASCVSTCALWDNEVIMKCILLVVILFAGCSPTLIVKRGPSERDIAISQMNVQVGHFTYKYALLEYGPPMNCTQYTDSTESKAVHIRTCVWNFGGSGLVTTSTNYRDASVGRLNVGVGTNTTEFSQDQLLKMGFINDTLRTFDLSGMILNTEPTLTIDTVKTEKEIKKGKSIPFKENEKLGWFLVALTIVILGIEATVLQ